MRGTYWHVMYNVMERVWNMLTVWLHSHGVPGQGMTWEEDND